MTTTKSARADGDAAFGEEFAQAFDGAVDALLGGLFARAESLRHLAGGLAFKIAQQQRVAVRLAQLAQRGVEMRGDVFPGGVRIRRKAIHSWQRPPVRGRGGAHRSGRLGREILRRAMQPAGQDRLGR